MLQEPGDDLRVRIEGLEVREEVRVDGRELRGRGYTIKFDNA